MSIDSPRHNQDSHKEKEDFNYHGRSNNTNRYQKNHNSRRNRDSNNNYGNSSRNQNNNNHSHSDRFGNKHNDNNTNNNRDSKYRYCCDKCKFPEKTNGKCCVCVVPRGQRRVKLGSNGCRSCGCRGCTKEDKYYFEQKSKGEYVVDTETTEYNHKNQRGNRNRGRHSSVR